MPRPFSGHACLSSSFTGNKLSHKSSSRVGANTVTVMVKRVLFDGDDDDDNDDNDDDGDNDLITSSHFRLEFKNASELVFPLFVFG